MGQHVQNDNNSLAWTGRNGEAMIKQYDISGEWGLCLDEKKEGIEKELWKQDLSRSDTMSLPGTTAQAAKGKLNDKRETGFLTELYPFCGYAWFQKEVHIDSEDVGKPMELLLERTRMTQVWLDGEHVGSYDSLTTPHRFSIGEYIKKENFVLTIMVSNTDYPTGGGHLTSPDTQSNWCGITGRMEIQVFGPVSLRTVKTYPDVSDKSVRIHAEVYNEGSQSRKLPLTVSAKLYDIGGDCGKEVKAQTYEVEAVPGSSRIEMNYALGEDAVLWSEYSPKVYHLQLALETEAEQMETSFGLRDFSKDKHHFLINGVETFLRGKHDGMIFPLTGAAPTTVKEWLKVMGISKEYGINHYRYHTCCPPEAAFEAADLLGIYMEPQIPFWGTLTDTEDEYYNEAEQSYLIEEGFRMLKEYGNHASFCMMSLGNELWGSKERMGEIIRGYKEKDARHLYTQGSNNFQHFPVILPEDDFWVGARLAPKNADGTNDRLVRGSFATCDAPIGYIQLEEPSTRHNYDAAILPETVAGSQGSGSGEIEIQYGTGVKKVKTGDGGSTLLPEVPVVGHEIGQYAVYPNFKEIDKYTGVFRARNFEIFRERLAEKGMPDQADDFFECSGKLSVQCYKEELEGFHRSRYSAGYQILDIQDFSGQGTALVGILDAFMDNKGHVSKEEWNGFCSDAVILAQFDTYILQAGDPFEMDLALSYYNQQTKLKHASVHYQMKTSDGKALLLEDEEDTAVSSYDDGIVAEGDVSVPDDSYGLVNLGNVNVSLPKVAKAVEITLEVSLYADGADEAITSNSYVLMLYPHQAKTDIELDDMESYVVITQDFAKANEALKEGRRVLYLPNELKESIQGFYCTDFWCYPMFRSISESMGKEVPVGTMGLCIQAEHPALSEFPSKKYTTPRWYGIVSNSDAAVLDDVTAKDYRPIVQVIDNFERNHKLGILFEGKAGRGKLLVCTSRLLDASMDGRIEARHFFHSILHYAMSDAFEPEQELDMEKLQRVFVS